MTTRAARTVTLGALALAAATALGACTAPPGDSPPRSTPSAARSADEASLAPTRQSERPRPAHAARPPTADDVLSGRVRPEDVPADIAAAIAPLLLPFDWDAEPDDIARRLELLRRMGPAAGTAVEHVVDSGGESLRLALATLDAIDPGCTLRMDSLVPRTLTIDSHSMDAEWALIAAGDASIGPLVDVLEGRREGNERAAARVLDALGARRPDVLAALRRVAAGSDHKDAEEAAKALFNLSGDREVVTEALLDQLRLSSELRARVVAVRPAVLDDALLLVSAESQDTRTSAALLLAQQGRFPAPVIQALVDGCADSGQEHAERCLEKLAQGGVASRAAVEPLVDRLIARPYSYEHASRLATAIVAIGEREATLPRLVEAFRARGGAARHIARTIAELDRANAAEVLLTPLVAQLAVEHTVGGGRTMYSGPRRTVRGEAWVADALGSLGEAAEPAVPALIRALEEDDLCANALDALVKIGPRAIPAVRDALSGPTAKTSGGAAAALILIDPSLAPDALPVLATALREAGRPQVSIWLDRLATRRRGWAPAVRAVTTDERPWVRVAAARALRRITGDAGPLVAVIRDAIRAEDGRRVACTMIAEAGTDAAEVASDLKLIPRQERSPPTDFVKAIVASGLPAAEAIPLLEWVIRADSYGSAKEAADAIASFGSDAAPAVPTLVRALERNEGDTVGIVRALVAIGAAAEPALPELRFLLTSRWEGERSAAREAIPLIEAAVRDGR